MSKCKCGKTVCGDPPEPPTPPPPREVVEGVCIREGNSFFPRQGPSRSPPNKGGGGQNNNQDDLNKLIETMEVMANTIEILSKHVITMQDQINQLSNKDVRLK